MNKKKAGSGPAKRVQAQITPAVPSDKKRTSRKAKGRADVVMAEKEEGFDSYLYEVTVIGTGILLSVTTELNKVPINLISSDQKKWKGAKKIVAGNRIAIHFVCIAPTSTEWKTSVTNMDSKKCIHGSSGETGANNRSEYEANVPSS